MAAQIKCEWKGFEAQVERKVWFYCLYFPKPGVGCLRPRPREDDYKRKLFYAFRPSVHTKTMKTLSKVDKFENAVYASSCGRP